MPSYHSSMDNLFFHSISISRMSPSILSGTRFGGGCICYYANDGNSEGEEDWFVGGGQLDGANLACGFAAPHSPGEGQVLGSATLSPLE